MTSPKAAALFGALVADAAALGLHWIYDVDRVAQVAETYGGPAFVPLDPAHHEDVPAYFAHGARGDGMNSQYGEVLALTMEVIRDQGGFDVAAYQQAYAGFFGAGGGYAGYIDRPTRGTLANLAAEVLEPSGIDDDQLPAVANLPAVLASAPDDRALRRAAMEVTNVNDVAAGYGDVFAHVLRAVWEGAPLPQALEDAAKAAPQALRDPLIQALETDEADSVTYGAITERACHLPQAMPLAFHILKHARDFRDGVERNILAGGDSCGRAIIVGSLLGAAGGVESIPLVWSLKLSDGAALWQLCRAI